MPGRGRGLHGGCAVPAAAHRVRGSVPGSGRARGLSSRPLPPRPAPLLLPRAARAHPRAALLPVRQRPVRRAPAPDLRARLCLLGARPGAALLPRTLRRLRAQPDLQVQAPGGTGRRVPIPGAGGAWGGLQVRALGGTGRGETGWGGPPAHRPRSRRAGPASWPSRPPARPPPAPPTAACWTRPLAACAPTPASWVRTAGVRARAGPLPGMPPPGWADYPASGSSAGTAVTPNYVDNASARVAPWCDCGASGNRREECEAFRGLFTRNRCLGEGPGREAPTAPSRGLAGRTLC